MPRSREPTSPSSSHPKRARHSGDAHRLAPCAGWFGIASRAAALGLSRDRGALRG